MENDLVKKMFSKEALKACDQICHSFGEFEIKHLKFIFKKVYLKKIKYF